MSPLLFCSLLLIAGVWSQDSGVTQIEQIDSQIKQLVDQIDDALTKIEDGIGSSKTKIWDRIFFYRDVARKLVDNVRNFIDLKTVQLEENLSGLIGRNISDTTCDLIGNFRDQAVLVFDNLRSCVNRPIDEVLTSAKNISDDGSEVRNTLQNYRKEVIGCRRNEENIPSALSCLAMASAKVAPLISTALGTAAEFTNIAITVSTLQQTIPACFATTPFEVIQEHYLQILVRLPECVIEKFMDGISNFWDKISSAKDTISEKFGNISDIEDYTNQAANSFQRFIPTPNIYDLFQYLDFGNKNSNNNLDETSEA